MQYLVQIWYDHHSYLLSTILGYIMLGNLILGCLQDLARLKEL